MKDKVKIGNKMIGFGHPAFIIADVGSNHDRNFGQAKKLIDIAAKSGVDAVKFQLFKAEFLYSPNHPLFKEVKKYELPREWVKKLASFAKSKGLIFLATPFDKEAIDLLDKLDVVAFKWASSETVNLSLLKYAASKKKPIILSTGMCNLADIYEAVEVVKEAGNDNLILMQCTALYPAKPEQIHFRVMKTLREAFNVPVGFSDHSLGILMSAVAVALGANVIEKHFTINRKLAGPDHSYALEPDELFLMVKNIRDVELSLGSQVKRMLPEEKKLARRESLFAKVAIIKNTPITIEMIEIKRPTEGIETRFLKAILGMKAKNNIRKGSSITWKDI